MLGEKQTILFSKKFKMKQNKKTSEEWFNLARKEFEFSIPNAAGWDRTNWEYSFNEECITFEEFLNRLNWSEFKCDNDKFQHWVADMTEKKNINERNIIEDLLDLNDQEIKQFYNSWDKGDCSLIGLVEIYLYQCIKKHLS